MGSTGVAFRYYKPAEFNALSRAQKTELIEHRAGKSATSNKSGGHCGGDRGGNTTSRKKRGTGGANANSGGGTLAARTKNKARQKAAAQVAAIAEKVATS